MINFKILSAYLMNNTATLYGLMGLIIVIIYYLIILALYGSDPARDDFLGDDSSIKTFMPPDGLSPAILRYIWRMGFWNLVWSDEFDGTGSPDPAKWESLNYNRRNNDSGPDGWWSSDDVYLDSNGHLVIR